MRLIMAKHEKMLRIAKECGLKMPSRVIENDKKGELMEEHLFDTTDGQNYRCGKCQKIVRVNEGGQAVDVVLEAVDRFRSYSDNAERRAPLLPIAGQYLRDNGTLDTSCSKALY